MSGPNHIEFYPEEHLIMLQSKGKVTSPDTGLEYEILVDMNGTPYVRSLQSMRKCRIDWAFLVHLAIENGVDEPHQKIVSGIPH
jgi:hypothetical protein